MKTILSEPNGFAPEAEMSVMAKMGWPKTPQVSRCGNLGTHIGRPLVGTRHRARFFKLVPTIGLSAKCRAGVVFLGELLDPVVLVYALARHTTI
ncbi:MAG: hypothetical protein HN366_04950 [Deltaproteobacteria bacterium]|jgi:hypothetical protein|nr:hypothetical protein [Deltaproteobacteria bacterium]